MVKTLQNNEIIIILDGAGFCPSTVPISPHLYPFKNDPVFFEFPPRPPQVA